ncbi:MAG: hypothetical protein MK129_01960 [SAR116 cluster bacterium]|nr:hypothetical protein [SAR116 cluster bacterium]
MRRINLILGLALSLSFPAAAHQCVLEGSTSEAIQSYNACKLDLATGQSGHGGDDQSAELARLKAENERLKARLADVRQRLLGLLGDL